MLLRFGVANHRSIRDFQELSFSVSSLRDRRDGLIACEAAPGGWVAPAAVVYGANASGKSNLVHAMRTMRAMVLFSQTQGRPGGGVSREPFRLDAARSGEPSRFELDFVVGGVRHHYGFEASDAAFESEWLYAFPKSHRRMLFEREGNEFHFGRGLKGRNSVIADLTRPNSLYLSAAAQNGHRQLSDVFGCIRAIGGVHEVDVPPAVAAPPGADEIDRRVIDFLGKIGTGVVGYRRNEIELSEIYPEMNMGDKLVVFELAHRGQDGEPVYLDLDRVSAGTRRLLITLGLAYRALDRGAPLFVDELDASLHTQAAEAVLRLFCSPETNPKGAQIVATTHDTRLMNSPALRRDQLWFVEKGDDGATRLFPLTDIRTRKGDDIERGYLQGRYGATPFDDPISALGAPR